MITPLEPVGVLNQRLRDYFGRFDNYAKWKLVWSEDFLEKRMIYETKDGFELLTPIADERKKCEYIKDRYILARVIPVPELQQADLCGAKVSYEPVWTFEDDKGNPVPVKWEAMKVLIEQIEANIGAGPGKYPKYKQDEKDGNTKEALMHRIDIIHKQLYGNETKITDSLAMDSAVGFGERRRKDWLQ